MEFYRIHLVEYNLFTVMIDINHSQGIKKENEKLHIFLFAFVYLLTTTGFGKMFRN